MDHPPSIDLHPTDAPCKRELVIGDTLISCETPAYVIAEIGHNHQGNLEICKRLFDAAKWAGCNAVKLQKRENRSLYSEEFYNTPYNSEHAFGPTYGEHREALEFGVEEYEDLKSYARRIGIDFFATAFDIPSANLLYGLGVPAIKIASGDLTNEALLRHVARFDTPILFSTGGGSKASILQAHRRLENKQLGIFQCTSGYPAKYEELNLRVIETFAEWFPNTVIGYSGHDTGITAPVLAYCLGARLIEKHFTLNRAMKGTDQAFSLEPNGMKQMIDNLSLARKALGDGIKRIYDSEIEPLKKQLKNKDGKIDGKTVPQQFADAKGEGKFVAYSRLSEAGLS